MEPGTRTFQQSPIDCGCRRGTEGRASLSGRRELWLSGEANGDGPVSAHAREKGDRGAKANGPPPLSCSPPSVDDMAPFSGSNLLGKPSKSSTAANRLGSRVVWGIESSEPVEIPALPSALGDSKMEKPPKTPALAPSLDPCCSQPVPSSRFGYG